MVARIFIFLCVIALVLPMLSFKEPRASGSAQTAQWPASINGREITQLPLSEKERRFNSGFPGDIARFTDGRREYVIRWISDASRKVHPAGDCFRGIGYTVKPQPLIQDARGNGWGAFVATKKNSVLKVQERIYDEQGNNWTDISSWYWAALFGKTRGPWWAVTVAERI